MVPHRPRRPDTLELQFSLLISIRNNGNCPGRDFVHPQVDPSRVSRAQRSTKRSGMMRCRPGTVPVCGGPGSAVHRSTPLRAAPRPGHAMASDAFVACRSTRWLVRSLYFPVFLRIRNLPSPVSRSQAHAHLLVPAAHFAPGVFNLCFAHPGSRGERSAERRSGAQRNTRGACHDAARQAPSEAPCVP
jgi:hypothetical protein